MKKIAILILTLAVMALSTACQCPPKDTETSGQTANSESSGKPDHPQQHEHTPVQVVGNPATCTEDGNRMYYSCNGCGKLFKDEQCQNETTAEAERIAATGHTDTDENNVCDTCAEPLMPTLPGGDDSTEMPKVEF